MAALVLFDIDGTLIRRAGPHHRQVLVDAVRAVAGLETTTEHIPVQGMLDRDILAAMMEDAGASLALIRRVMPEVVRRAQSLYIRRCPNLSRKVCPGARMLLYRLSRRRVVTGLVTGNLTRIGWKKMECAGLDGYFRFGAFAESARDRAGLVRLAIGEARRKGWIDRSSPVSLIGDHPNDVRAARANGIRAVAVATGIAGADELRQHSPDVLVDDLRSLEWEMLLKLIKRKTIVAVALVCLAGCKPSEDSRMKALIGAILIDGTGGPPISDSVVLVSGARIRQAGMRANIQIPAGSDKLDMRGKFIMPAIVDLKDDAGLPEISRLAEAKERVQNGATGLRGAMLDGADAAPAFTRQLRDLRVVIAPHLALYEKAPLDLERARASVKRLAGEGVAIGVASAGDVQRELELLVAAGLSPAEVIQAGTKNGAMAAKKDGQSGTIEAGKAADLIVLAANPLDDISNLRKVERVMKAGEWVESK